MPHDQGFVHHGNHYFKAAQVDDPELIFYPTLRYRGVPVSVFRGWHPDSEEPVLGCVLGDINPAVEAESGTSLAMIVEANRRRADDERAWKGIHAERHAAAERVIQQLLDDGWTCIEPGSYFKYVPVEDPDLEKIEGPPPDGPF